MRVTDGARGGREEFLESLGPWPELELPVQALHGCLRTCKYEAAMASRSNIVSLGFNRGLALQWSATAT